MYQLVGVYISILYKLKHLLLKSLTGALIVCGNAADCTNYAGGDNGEAACGSERWCGLLLASRSLTKMYRFIIMPQNYHFRVSTGNNHN